MKHGRQVSEYDLNREIMLIYERSQGKITQGDVARLKEIYEVYDFAPAAEIYAFALLEKGDIVLARDWFLRAARHGLPGSSAMTHFIIGQRNEFSGMPVPRTVGPAYKVLEDCLKLAFANGQNDAGLHLAELMIVPPDTPAHLARKAGFDDEYALQLLDRLHRFTKEDNATRIAALVDIAQDRMKAVESEKEQARAQQAVALKPRAEKLSGLCDGAIQIKGVCWAQSKEQIRTVFVSRGYKCELLDAGYEQILNCAQGDANVLYANEMLIFSCANFNACSFSAAELGKTVLGQGLVRSLDLNIESRYLSNTQILTPTYCGRGAKGDELCVVEDDERFFGSSRIHIRLAKGTFGSGGLSFD